MLGGRNRIPSEIPWGSRRPTDCVSPSRTGKNSRLRSFGYSIEPSFVVSIASRLYPFSFLPDARFPADERQHSDRKKDQRRITILGSGELDEVGETADQQRHAGHDRIAEGRAECDHHKIDS